MPMEEDVELIQYHRQQSRTRCWYYGLYILMLALVISDLVLSARNFHVPEKQIILQGIDCPTVVFPTEECPGVASKASGNEIRARDLGIPFDGTPGQYNAITDVPGVLVGHSTIICGEGKLEVGVGPVRTGVTAILPRGIGGDAVSAATYSLSGNGAMTGVQWIEESGCLVGPVVLTNTNSVGSAYDSVTRYSIPLQEQYPNWFFQLPVVSETWDGYLNDIDGLHVHFSHVKQALESATTGYVAEGSVGGGTGMITFDWKSGAGTASRLITANGQNYTVGVYVQSNHGYREDMIVAGVPVGKETENILLPQDGNSTNATTFSSPVSQHKYRSFVAIIATDAPLRPTEMQRLVKRAVLGYGRDGGVGLTNSGDLFLAFTTGSKCEIYSQDNPVPLPDVSLDLNPFIYAAIEGVEEAMINSLIAAKDMIGIDNNTVYAIPHDLLQDVMRKYNRLNEK